MSVHVVVAMKNSLVHIPNITAETDLLRAAGASRHLRGSPKLSLAESKSTVTACLHTSAFESYMDP